MCGFVLVRCLICNCYQNLNTIWIRQNTLIDNFADNMDDSCTGKKCTLDDDLQKQINKES